MKCEINLSGKTALITGGARGIGEAITRTFAAAGAKIIIDFNKSGQEAENLRDELRSEGCESEIFQADVSQPAEVKRLFQFISSSCGRLDVLVNNAGIIRDSLLLTMDISDWDKVHDLNLRSAFLTTRMAAELMVPAHSGKIVNVASIAALQCARGQTNYASSKGGLISFTRACAVELASKGIQVNAVLPGVIETAMSARARKRAGKTLVERIPAQRYGSPQEGPAWCSSLPRNSRITLRGRQSRLMED